MSGLERFILLRIMVGFKAFLGILNTISTLQARLPLNLMMQSPITG